MGLVGETGAKMEEGPHGAHYSETVKRIGLTGPIGAGKSTVARLLSEAGVPVLDADRLAHEALKARALEVCARFPEACSGGEVDRKALAQIVFADPARRRALEAIVHPYVRARLLEALKALEAEGADLVVLEIPLLFEVGWEKMLDGVLVVDAPWPVREARLLARGVAPEDARRREAAQLPPEEKRRRATWVIENRGDLAELSEKVRAWLKEVR